MLLHTLEIVKEEFEKTRAETKSWSCSNSKRATVFNLGLLGLVYLLARPLAKFVGAYFVGKRFKADPNVTKGLGMALLPQAGVAIGMVMVVNKVDAELGALLGAVILSSVVVYESIGPFLTRLALSKAGEIHLQE